MNALEQQPLRMAVATYSCVVHVTQEEVGRVYSVLGRRHGRVLHGDMTEGSQSWSVTALLPIAESMDFANELRRAVSVLVIRATKSCALQDTLLQSTITG